MTLEEEYKISCYEQLTKMSEDKEVWLVRNVEDGRIYVKKKINMYNKEIYHKLSEVKVDNIPEIFLLVEDVDGLIVIEEYIHGRTLADILNTEGVLEEERAVNIIQSVLNILKELHGRSQPIIHRDIKPQNIMISNDGIVKLIDFNAAREEKHSTQDTYFMGTVEYAAPEQYGFGQSDVRTDIYACGIVLNRMLTGQLPKEKLYEGKLGKIIKKCVQLERDKRYRSVGELMKALNSVRRSQYSAGGWLPVGFRTNTLWKSILALIGYGTIILVSIGGTWHDEDGNPVKAEERIVYNTLVFVILIGYVLIIGNYRGVRDRLPHVRGNIVINVLLCVIYMFLYTIVMAIIALLAIEFIK